MANNCIEQLHFAGTKMGIKVGTNRVRLDRFG